MTNTFKPNRIPFVGEVVLSKRLKIRRLVEAVTETTVTLSPIKATIFGSFFENILSNFKKTMDFEEFNQDYLFSTGEELNDIFTTALTVSFTPFQLASVFIKSGGIYKHKESGERVILDTISKDDEEKILFVNLLSRDKMLDGDWVSYKVKEKYFVENFITDEKAIVYTKDLALSF